MSMARVALGVVALVCATRTSTAQPCAPRAELAGDAEAVASVKRELERLGVEASTAGAGALARSECPVIVAAVELDESGGIAVAVRDSSQRSEGRVVSDAELAAAWIDSWLRDDFVGVEREAPRSLPPSMPSLPPGETPAQTATDAPVLERFALAASYVQTWTDDHSSWTGFAGSGCVVVGGVCIGVRAGYARQDVTAALSAATKRDLSLLATVSYSYVVGRMSVAPELGLGIGMLTTSRVEGCKPVMDTTICDPNDPTTCDESPPVCEGGGTDPGQVYVGDNLYVTSYTPRVSAALRVAIPLFEHVWLDGLVGATIAPFGHRDEYGDAPDAPTMMPNTAPETGATSYPVPGDPRYGFQLGIGLRLGAR